MYAEIGSGGFAFFTGLVSGTDVEEPTVGPVQTTVPDTITLDGYTYAIETESYRFASQDTFRDSVVSGGVPNDSLFNAKGAWARYVYSWDHGGDQEVGDFADDADPFRFRGSDNVDPWTRYQATLLPSTTMEQACTSATPQLLRSGDYVYLADGPDLYRTTDLETWTAMTDPGGTIQALATDGSDLYVATSTVLVKYVGAGTSGTAFGTAVTGNVTNVAFVANRLLIGMDNLLKEVGSSGLQTTIRTHFQTAFRWTTIFNIGSRIYCGGFAGARSELYTLTTDSSGNLVLSNEAAPLPTGELLRTGIPYGGAAMLCSSLGVRLAQISGDGTLTYGPLIDDVGDVRCATADGRFAYTGWSSYPRSTGSGTARLALDTFVDALQPAYTADVAALDEPGTVTGIARLAQRTAFAVATAGVYVQAAEAYQPLGHVLSGRIYFGTIEPKRLVELEVGFAALAAGESVTATVNDDTGAVIGLGTMDENNATSLTIALGGAEVDWAEVEITLQGDGTSTPRLDRWRLRAYPVPPTTTQWILPIINHELVTVNDAQGQDMAQNPLEIRDRLVGLYESKKLVNYSEGDRNYRVRVEGFEVQPAKWTNDGKYFQGLFVLQLVTT